MSENNKPEDSAFDRVAVTLFLFCLITIVGICLYNEKYVSAVMTYGRKSVILDRLELCADRIHSFELKDPEFFAALSEDAVFGLWFKDKRPNFFEAEGVESESYHFGQLASAAWKSAYRENGLNAAVKASFSEPSEVTLLKATVLPRLSTIDQPENWSDVVRWIINGRFFTRDPFQASDHYFDALIIKDPETSWLFSDEAEFMARLLNRSAPTSARSIIEEHVTSALAELQKTSATSPEIGVPGANLTLPIVDLLVGAGPTIVVLYCIFITKRPSSRRKSCFPQFGSPDDPFEHISYSINAFSERVPWLIFLLLPPLILSCGFFTRYRLAAIDYSDIPDRTSWPFIFREIPSLPSGGASLLMLRGTRSSSLWLDAVNLTSLWLVIAMTLQIGSRRKQPIPIRSSRSLWVGVLTLFSSALFLERLLFPGLPLGLVSNEPLLMNLPVALFGIIGSWGLWRAARQESPAVAIISAIIMTLSGWVCFS